MLDDGPENKVLICRWIVGGGCSILTGGLVPLKEFHLNRDAERGQKWSAFFLKLCLDGLAVWEDDQFFRASITCLWHVFSAPLTSAYPL